MVRAELPPQVGLIGFAGALFALFCYLVSGKPSEGIRYRPGVCAGRTGLDHGAIARSPGRCDGRLFDRPGFKAGAQALHAVQIVGWTRLDGMISRDDCLAAGVWSGGRLEEPWRAGRLGRQQQLDACCSISSPTSMLTFSASIGGALLRRPALPNPRFSRRPCRATSIPATLFASPQTLRRRVAAMLEADAGPAPGHTSSPSATASGPKPTPTPSHGLSTASMS